MHNPRLLLCPPGKILLWDEVALQSAATLVDEYNTFVTSELNQVNPELRTVFKIVARNQIRTKVMNLIARAQTYIDEPINTLSLRRRGFLTNQVQNFKSVLPLFATLLGSFESGGFILTSSGVRELILNQCYTILRKADAILQADGLYQVRGNTLSWWGGEEYLGFYAFGVHDNDGMSAYLSAQREQMTILAQEIVQPVLEFLSLGHLERAPEDLPLVMVWRRIIKQLEAYDRKEPENSVALLEEYVSVTMNQLQVHQAVIDKPFKEGDFFLKRRRAIQKLVQERTLTLARTNLYKTYNKIANFFNVSLAGLYPFTDKEKMNVSDARPEDVNTLLKFLSLMTPADMATLDAEHKTSKEAEQAFLFINHLKVLRPLLQVTLDKQFDQSIQKIDFSVAFRTNKAHENLVGQATEWSFISGISTIDRRSEQITLPWSTGDTLLVSFKFAASSHYNPMVDRSQQLLIDNKSAQFVYTGKWGLIRLIQHHQIIMQPEKPGVFRLRFQIPMQFYDVTVKKIVKHTQGFVFFTDIGFSLADNEPLMRQIPPPFPHTCAIVRPYTMSNKNMNDFLSQVLSEHPKLLDPIASGSLCGKNIKHTESFDKIKDLRSVDHTQGRDIDWYRIEKKCLKILLTASKDLHVLAWLTEAWVRLYWMKGLRGLALIDAFLKKYWDALYPQIKAGDIAYRISPLLWIDAKLTPQLRLLPLGEGIDGGYTYNDWCKTRRVVPEKVTENQLSSFQIVDSLVPLGRSALVEKKQTVQEVLILIEKITLFMKDKKFQEPLLNALLKSVCNIASIYEKVLKKIPVQAPLTKSQIAKSPVISEENIQIIDRAHAYALLEDIAIYLQETEPHSPTPYLIKRAIVWGSKSLGDLLKDLFQSSGGNLPQILSILGLDTNDKPVTMQAQKPKSGNLKT